MQGAIGFELIEELGGGAGAIGAREEMGCPGLRGEFAVEGVVRFEEIGVGQPVAVFETVVDAQADAGDGDSKERPADADVVADPGTLLLMAVPASLDWRRAAIDTGSGVPPEIQESPTHEAVVPPGTAAAEPEPVPEPR